MRIHELPSESGKNLKITLEELGIRNIVDQNIEIISFSPRDESRNKAIYKIVNEGLLHTIEERDPGEIIHITGEMRAISDPMHREVCRNMWEKYHHKVNINFNLPEGFSPTGREILDYNRRAWGGTTWNTHLAVFDLIGDGIVNLYNTPQLEKIHFSLFEKKKILLQSMHEHYAHSKDVWILESESLFNKLFPYSKQVQEKSEFLQPNIFKRFIFSINSNIALQSLFTLHDNGPIEKTHFFEELKTLSIDYDNTIKDLSMIGFINEKSSLVNITSDGEDYLKLLN